MIRSDSDIAGPIPSVASSRGPRTNCAGFQVFATILHPAAFVFRTQRNSGGLPARGCLNIMLDFIIQ